MLNLVFFESAKDAFNKLALCVLTLRLAQILPIYKEYKGISKKYAK